MNLVINSLAEERDEITFLPLVWFINVLKLVFRNLGWKRLSLKDCIFSKVYGFQGNAWSDYWKEVGKKEALIEITILRGRGVKSYSWKELILRAVHEEFRYIPVLILSDWDISKLGVIESRIKAMIPDVKRMHFYDEFIVIPCKDLDTAMAFRDSIPLNLCNRMIINKGTLVQESKDYE